MRTSRRRLLLAGLAFAFGSPTSICAGQIQSAAIQWPAYGERVVERRISLLGVAQLRIGTGTGTDSVLLSGIVGAVRMADGRIIVGDAASAQLLVFDSRGRQSAGIGRAGSGPSEFRMLRWVGRCDADRIGAYDGYSKRLQVFGPDRSLRSARTLPAFVRNFDSPVRCASDGQQVHVLLNQLRNQVARGLKQEAVVPLIHLRPDDSADTLIGSGAQEYYSAQRVPGTADIPLGHAILAAGGRRLVVAVDNMSGVVSTFDSFGKRRGSFTLPFARRPATERDWEIAKESRLTREPLARTRRVLAQIFEELPRPRELPLVDALHVDLQDRIWVKSFHAYASEVAYWFVIDADGTPQAVVAAPRRFALLEVGADYVLGAAWTGDGEETVELRQLTVPAGK